MAITRSILLIVPKECTAASGQRLMPETYSGSMTRHPFEGEKDRPVYLLAGTALDKPVDVTRLVESGLVKVIGG